MNLQRLTVIADWLAAGAPHRGRVVGFDIRVGVRVTDGDASTCGTVCCIAGAATQFFNDHDNRLKLSGINGLRYNDGEAEWEQVFEEARSLLDLTETQALKLFMPNSDHTMGVYGGESESWADITPYQAAKVIYNFMETGQVDWNIR